MRACHTNNCPVGIATQKENLRSRLVIEKSAKQLKNFFEATVELMKILARADTSERAGKPQSADREVLDGPLRLGSPVGLFRDLHITHGI